MGDLAYEVDALIDDRVPGIGDAPTLRDSFAKVRALRQQLANLAILPSHDVDTAGALAAVD